MAHEYLVQKWFDGKAGTWQRISADSELEAAIARVVEIWGRARPAPRRPPPAFAPNARAPAFAPKRNIA